MKNIRLPTETETALFRIAQEALNNVVQHAKASQVDIELFEDENGCMMVVNDNGVGINVDHQNLKSPDHWGLLIMEERARAINGDFLIRSVPDQGTQVVVQVRKTK